MKLSSKKFVKKSAATSRVRLLGILKTLFSYVGKGGREIFFGYDACFKDESIYEFNEVIVAQYDGATIGTCWRSLQSIL